LDAGSDNKVYDGDKYLGKVTAGKNGSATAFTATQAGFAYLDSHKNGATSLQSPHGEATPTGRPTSDASNLGGVSTTPNAATVGNTLSPLPYGIGVDPYSNLNLDQQAARWMAPGVGLVQCVTGDVSCSGGETAAQVAAIPLQIAAGLAINKAANFVAGKIAGWMAGDVAGSGAADAPLVLRSAGADVNRSIDFDGSQLQAKFKHAADFGVQGNWNRDAATAFQGALERHTSDPSTVLIQGTYRGQDVTHFFNPNTGLNVMRDSNMQFLSGWRLNAAQQENLLRSGSLGGN
jgi:hypothetical protein